MDKLFNYLKQICKSGSKDQAKMLIFTSAAGWALSSLAQVGAIITNDKIPQKEKHFLIPQEIYDGLTNIATFLLITTLAKNQIGKLIDKNKIVFVGKDKAPYGDAVKTITAIITGAIASNIITPFVRNYLGACAQKRILSKKESYNQPVKTVSEQVKETMQSVKDTQFSTAKFLYPTSMGSGLRIN